MNFLKLHWRFQIECACQLCQRAVAKGTRDSEKKWSYETSASLVNIHRHKFDVGKCVLNRGSEVHMLRLQAPKDLCSSFSRKCKEKTIDRFTSKNQPKPNHFIPNEDASRKKPGQQVRKSVGGALINRRQLIMRERR